MHRPLRGESEEKHILPTYLATNRALIAQDWVMCVIEIFYERFEKFMLFKRRMRS